MKFKLTRNRALSIALIMVLCSGLVFTVWHRASAAPESWDMYHELTGNGDIWSVESGIMATYDDGYETVPTPADEDGSAPSALGTPNGHGWNVFTPGAVPGSYNYTSINIDVNHKVKSKWYISPYGPELDYISKYITGSTQQEKLENQENRSIEFANQNNAWNSSYAYAGSGDSDGELSDIKSAAMVHYQDNAVYPLLVNSSSDGISSAIQGAMYQHNIKNIVLLGGGARFTALSGIGQNYNTVRIGGKERNETYHYLQLAEAKKDTIYSMSAPPTLNPQGYYYDLSGYPDVQLEVEAFLAAHDFNGAALKLLKDASFGSESNIQSGSCAAEIACVDKDDSSKVQVLRIYLMNNSESTGSSEYGVYSYIGDNYFGNTSEPPTQPPTINNVTANIYAPADAVVGVPFSVSSTGNANDANDRDTISYMSSQLFFDHTRVDNDTGQVYSDANLYVPHSYLLHTDKYDTLKSSANINYDDMVDIDKEGTYFAYNFISSDGGWAYAPTDYTQSYLTHKAIRVTYPTPQINLTDTGTFKENRKIALDISSSTSGSPICDIDWSKTQWSIKAVTGGSNSDSDVRIQTHTQGSTNGTVIYDGTILNTSLINQQKTLDVQFKKAGKYVITATIYNNYTKNSKFPNGVPATASITLDIAQDQAPTALIDGPLRNLRDPNDHNNIPFKAWATNISSPDGDSIKTILWVYAFDSNNDGNRKDETWYDIDPSTLQEQQIGDYNTMISLIPDNFTTNTIDHIEFKKQHLGNYTIYAIVEESPGQDYIPQFFTNDCKKVSISN